MVRALLPAGGRRHADEPRERPFRNADLLDIRDRIDEQVVLFNSPPENACTGCRPSQPYLPLAFMVGRFGLLGPQQKRFQILTRPPECGVGTDLADRDEAEIRQVLTDSALR